MNRTKSYRRDMRNRKIAHRKYICKNVYLCNNWYKNDGQYSKGKIHCSCKMCTYNKFYDLPTHKSELDAIRVKDALNDMGYGG